MSATPENGQADGLKKAKRPPQRPEKAGKKTEHFSTSATLCKVVGHPRISLGDDLGKTEGRSARPKKAKQTVFYIFEAKWPVLQPIRRCKAQRAAAKGRSPRPEKAKKAKHCLFAFLGRIPVLPTIHQCEARRAKLKAIDARPGGPSGELAE